MESGAEQQGLVLVSGATGYIGGRLVPRLRQKGWPVRCIVRDPERLAGRGWEGVEAVKGDMFKPETLAAAMQGVRFAFYLVHSLQAWGDYTDKEKTSANNFAQAAKAAGVERIIYLSGLGRSDDNLSAHLRSRQLAGEALRQAGVPVTEFRAGVIIGSGSASFEIVRHLTERLPLMLTPRWVRTRAQPISIADVLHYLVDSLEVSEAGGQIVEIGGGDIVSYQDMMLLYAKVRGLRRAIIPLPVLTPKLSAGWVALFSSVPINIVFPLIGGVKNEVVVTNDLAARLFPHIRPMTCEAAIRLALERVFAGTVETAWSDALSSVPSDPAIVKFSAAEGIFREERRMVSTAELPAVFRTITCIGGEQGYFYGNILWRIRGLIDQMVGGVGLSRGRRCPFDLRVGDALDFWRVEAYEPDRLLRLRAEMKLPGKAWLEFRVRRLDKGVTEILQTAWFEPHGVSGRLYWWAMWPFHRLLFTNMMRKLEQTARENSPGGKDAVSTKGE